MENFPKEVKKERLNSRNVSGLVINVENRLGNMFENNEDEIKKEVLERYREGKSETDIKLEVSMLFGISCCFDVKFENSQIIIKIY